MAGNGALDLSIRIMGKVDPSLVTAIKQTKGLTGDLASALTGTKSLGSTVANTLGVIGKTGLGIMATLTTASAVMIKKTTSMAEEYQAQAADAVKYVGGIMNDDGSIDPEKRATMEDAILKMTTQVPIKRDEMAQIAASLGQSGKSYEQIFLDNQQTGEKATCTIRPDWPLRGTLERIRSRLYGKVGDCVRQDPQPDHRHCGFYQLPGRSHVYHGGGNRKRGEYVRRRRPDSRR